MGGTYRPMPRANCIYCNSNNKCTHEDKRKKFIGLFKYKPECQQCGCEYRVKRYERPSTLIGFGSLQTRKQHNTINSTPKTAQTDDALLHIAAGMVIANSIHSDNCDCGSSSSGYSSSDSGSFDCDGSFD